MSLTETHIADSSNRIIRYDPKICPAEWMKMLEDAQSRDAKRKYQSEEKETLKPITTIELMNILSRRCRRHPYDKPVKTNLFDLFTAADTQYLYRMEGDKVYQVRVDQLKDKYVILYLLRDFDHNVELTTPEIITYNNVELITPEIIPDLIETYNEHGKTELEIVFVWLGHDKEAFYKQFFFMPWLAVSPLDDKTIRVLTEEVEFPGPMSFLQFDRDGFLCLYNAFTHISAYGVRGYPFTQKKIKELTKEADELRSKIMGRKHTLHDILGDYVISPTGDKVPTSDLENKTVGLYMLGPFPNRKILKGLKRICEDHKEDFVLIPIIRFYHSSWSWIRAGCSDLEHSIPWHTLPDIQCRYLDKVFHNNLNWRYVNSEIFDLFILKTDKHLPVSFFALHIFALFGLDAYPFTIESAVQLAKKEQQNIVLKEILSSTSTLRKQGSAGSVGEVITVSDLDRKNVLLLFGTHGCEWESLLSTIKNVYVDKRRVVEFEIIYIHLDISLESTSSSSTIEKMPWVVHSSKPEVAVSLFECVFPISAHLPAIAAFGVNGHLETKGSDLAAKGKLLSQYPFIQADMYDEVCQELKDEHGWDFEDLFYSPEEIS